MKIFAGIDQYGHSQTNVDSIKTQTNAVYYNADNLVAATTTAMGLLSAADKTKLDGIAEGANKYVLPAATTTALGGVKVDAALSSTSTNPVQNKAVNTAITNHTGNTSNPHGVTKTQVGLGNVEDTALSSWTGSTKITTLGTIATGVWQGSKIANAYLANNAISINGTSVFLGESFTTANISAGTAGTSSATSGYTLSVPYVTVNKYGIVTAYGTHTHTVNNIPNSSLANSKITIAGVSVSLGGSITAATIGNALTTGAPAAYATRAGQAVNDGNGNNIANALAGKAASVHTHSYTDCNIGGGGENGRLNSLGARFSGVYGNIFHGLPASAIVTEYSSDSGATWTETDWGNNKRLATSGTSAIIGALNGNASTGTTHQFRVTIDAAAGNFYGITDRIYMDIGTDGSTACWCSVYTRPSDTETYTLRGTYGISGWNGWNSVPFEYLIAYTAPTSSGRVRYIRLVFGGNHTTSSYGGLRLLQLYATAVMKYTTTNQMVASGVPYTVDPDLNTTFASRVTAATLVNSSYNSAYYFLMGDGTVTTKKNLTTATHCGWTSVSADALLVPTMNTIAYWNGAYSSAGNSNLAYCNKGAFGTFAAKSSLAFSELTSKPTTLAGYGITDSVKIVYDATNTADYYRTISAVVRNHTQSGFPFIHSTMLSLNAIYDTFAQMVFPYYSNGVVYVRSGVTSASPDWVLQLNANNYSSYALPLTGGTLTGALTVQSTITATGTISSSTGIYSTGYVSARGQDTSSDISLKKDLRPIEGALDYIIGTKFRRFRWRDDDAESVGIIAQEEQEREYGFLVRKHDEVGHLTYDYAASTALIGAALQEEDRKVEELKARVAELENELKTLRYGNH